MRTGAGAAARAPHAAHHHEARAWHCARLVHHPRPGSSCDLAALAAHSVGGAPLAAAAAPERARARAGSSTRAERVRARLSVGAGAAILLALCSQHECEKTLLERAPVGLFYPLGSYCGPANGREYNLRPVDGLDVVCAQHDYCIERSESLGHLYPKGSGGGAGRPRAAPAWLRGSLALTELTEGGALSAHAAAAAAAEPAEDEGEEGEEPLRCGAPLGAWKAPHVAPAIASCDLQMLRSLQQRRVDCSGAGLARSPWCDLFEQLPVCVGGAGTGPWGYRAWGPRGLACRFAATYIRAFEGLKLARNVGFQRAFNGSAGVIEVTAVTIEATMTYDDADDAGGADDDDSLGAPDGGSAGQRPPRSALRPRGPVARDSPLARAEGAAERSGAAEPRRRAGGAAWRMPVRVTLRLSWRTTRVCASSVVAPLDWLRRRVRFKLLTRHTTRAARSGLAPAET